MATTRTTRPASDLAYLCRALKAPSLAAAIDRLAQRARSEGWTHKEFLAACLEREVAARQDHGGEGRIRAARLPARKTLEDFDYSFQRSLKRDLVAHLGTLDFVAERSNVVFLGPPGTGKTHLAIGLGDPRLPSRPPRRCSTPLPNGSPASATPTPTVDSTTNSAGSAAYPLLVVDEVGYIPFEAEAANLFFQLISSRYERASVIVTSNKPFGRWGEVFGDPVVAAAMIDRLVHHADVVSLKGDSYRLKDRDLGRVPTDDAT